MFVNVLTEDLGKSPVAYRGNEPAGQIAHFQTVKFGVDAFDKSAVFAGIGVIVIIPSRSAVRRKLIHYLADIPAVYRRLQIVGIGKFAYRHFAEFGQDARFRAVKIQDLGKRPVGNNRQQSA